MTKIEFVVEDIHIKKNYNVVQLAYVHLNQNLTNVLYQTDIYIEPE